MTRTITARLPATAVATVAAIALTACSIAGTVRPAVTSTTVPAVTTTATSATRTVDPAAVLSASMASVASAQAATDAAAAANGWYTPSGNRVSPETAALALAAGISPGDTVPNYLRCGTICGEGPTSGEVQAAHACKDGLMTAEQCAGTDSDAIIAAASSYSGW